MNEEIPATPEHRDLISAIRIYMSTSEDIALLREEAPEKANPIFIFARISPVTFELGASTLRSGAHMPNFSMVFDREKAGLATAAAARAYQMGLCHGLRSQELAALTGPTFDSLGEIVFEASSYADEIEMIYGADPVQPDIGEEYTNEEELENE